MSALRLSHFTWLLRPFSLLYGGVMAVRNRLFDLGVLHEARFPLPIIAVGNLSVGGTGKTPHVEYLLRLLSPHWQTAVLSRGYGRSTSGFRWVRAASLPHEVGDEPCQMKRKFPEATVVVDADRREGIRRLLQSDTEVVIMDDAYQHRYVKPGLLLLLTDYRRLYCDDHVLPEGRLREFPSGSRRADCILVTKCPPDLTEADCAALRRRLSPTEDQSLFFTTLRYGELQPLFEDIERPQGKKVLVISGIAHPEALLEHVGGTCEVRSLRFPDHHVFTRSDVQRMNAAFAGCDFAVTTEKDAVRLAPLREHFSSTLRAALYVQPVEATFLHESAPTFQTKIKNYVIENQRNSRVD